MKTSVQTIFSPHCAVLLTALWSSAAIMGCGGSGETTADSSTPATSSDSDAAPTSPPGMSADPAMSGGAGSMPGGVSMPVTPGGPQGNSAENYPGAAGYPGAADYPGANGQPGAQAAAKPARPANFDAWTEADFVAAVEESDKKVLEAIDFKVKSAPGDSEVAILLTKLLSVKPLSGNSNSAAGAEGGYPGGAGYSSAYPGGTIPGADASAPMVLPGSEPGSPSGSGGTSSAGGSQAPGIPKSGGSEPSPGAAPVGAPGVAPQSSLDHSAGDLDAIKLVAGVQKTDDSRGAVDSVSAMILEAAVSYAPQSAGVGAIAGQLPGRITDAAGQSSAGSMPGGAIPNGATPGNAAPAAEPPANTPPMDSSAAGNYPNGAYPGGGNPDAISGTQGAVVAGRLQARALVERVIDGLVTNNSQDAWQAVFGIVSGTLETRLDGVSNCEIVVERLVHHMDSNSAVIQPILLTFLDGSTPLPAESRSACMKMLAAISASQTDLLTGFAVPNSPPAAAAGSDAMGGNPGAVPGGGGSEQPQITGFPGMAGSGGVAAATQPSLPQVSLDPDVLAKGAKFLWSPKAMTAVVRQLEKTTDLTTAADVLLLASTIPGTETRHAICETFMRLHAAGSTGLNAAGIFNEVHDPAMLVVLKTLPRTRPAKETAGTMDSWTSSTETLVLALRNELRRTSGSLQQYNGVLPVKLHKNAVAQVSVMMQFPPETAVAPTDPVPAATQVYYTRTTFSPQRPHDAEDLIGHYETRTGGFQRPDPTKGILWIEGVKTYPNGHRRSMDVIVQQASNTGQSGFEGSGPPGAGGGGFGGSAGAGAGGGTNGAYTVEIIVVDTVDPKTLSAPGVEQASN